ncbi:hypothetical protein SAMN05444336_107102 [Albimonas donghaensis]|uniref:Uncharacterized protein n=1 Tax=Albimonas donghaensis TaxID=356660 RepID=A0A1H3D6V4_9RHOB|nr:hypothetical protein [Albimonas donghaensis]SDX61409.1 hypothetical protein SAMN05444336_107102 [Albimonas donghaensis]
MLLKTLGKYVLMPTAGIGMLASFGMFDLGEGVGKLSVDNSSPAAVGETMLAALEGPLEVARKIAAAGSSIIGGSGELPDFMGNVSSAGDLLPSGDSVTFGSGGAGAAPVAARKTVSVPQAGDGGQAQASALSASGVGKSSRPPQVTAD